MNKEITLQDKRHYCMAWEKSGKSRRAFCKVNGISSSTFQGWYHQYKTECSSEKLFSPMVSEPPVPSTATKESDGVPCEIRFPNETQRFISLQERALVSIIQEICHAATTISW